MERLDELAQGATRLFVTLDMGDVTIRADERQGWSADWDEDEDDAPIVERDGSTVRIRQHSGGHRLNLTVSIPREVDHLELHTGHGPISLNGVDAQMDVRTGWGEVSARSVGGSLDFKTGWGELVVVEPRRLNVRGSTGFGDITLDGGSLSGASLKTGHGDVRGTSTLLAGNFHVRTETGSVEVAVPEGIRTRIEAQTSMGKIESDIPLVRVGRPGQRDPGGRPFIDFGGARMVGTTGDGHPELDLSVRTNNGWIRLRRVAAAPDATTVDEASRMAEWIKPIRQVRDEPAPAAEPQVAEAHQTIAGGETEDELLRILEAVARGELSPGEADQLLNAATR